MKDKCVYGVYLAALFVKKCPANSDDGSRQDRLPYARQCRLGQRKGRGIFQSQALTPMEVFVQRDHNVVASQDINFSMENGHVCQATTARCAKLECRSESSMDRPLRREAWRRFLCTDNSCLLLCYAHTRITWQKIWRLAAPSPPNGHRCGSWCAKLCQNTSVQTLAPVRFAHGAREKIAEEDKI